MNLTFALRPGWCRCAFVLLLMLAPAMRVLAQTPSSSSGAAAPSGPQVLLVVHLRDPNFRIVNIKFRAFFNKIEPHAVPLTDYDLAAALSDELLSTLSADGRARWRLPEGDEKLYLASYFEEKTSQGNLPASVKADRLLLVDVGGFSLSTHSTAHRFGVTVELKMIDRSTNRILWKKGYYKKLSNYKRASLEELVADDQKLLKENLNRLMEEFSAEARKAVAEKGL